MLISAGCSANHASSFLAATVQRIMLVPSTRSVSSQYVRRGKVLYEARWDLHDITAWLLALTLISIANEFHTQIKTDSIHFFFSSIYKYSIIIKQSQVSGVFCSSIENKWNISSVQTLHLVKAHLAAMAASDLLGKRSYKVAHLSFGSFLGRIIQAQQPIWWAVTGPFSHWFPNRPTCV